MARVDCNFEVIELSEFKIVIKDVGPYDQYMSVTNAVENCLSQLRDKGLLKNRRLFYIDSTDQLDEIMHKDGYFVTFHPGPKFTEGERFKLEEDWPGFELRKGDHVQVLRVVGNQVQVGRVFGALHESNFASIKKKRL